MSYRVSIKVSKPPAQTGLNSQPKDTGKSCYNPLWTEPSFCVQLYRVKRASQRVPKKCHIAIKMSTDAMVSRIVRMEKTRVRAQQVSVPSWLLERRTPSTMTLFFFFFFRIMPWSWNLAHFLSVVFSPISCLIAIFDIFFRSKVIHRFVPKNGPKTCGRVFQHNSISKANLKNPEQSFLVHRFYLLRKQKDCLWQGRFST